ncbi:DUF2892 domain-containing protein [Seleniivibrio sp.]|uniref:YgaP family membrane protein n=1 Tax=Seleniivibrio sp. TaxID=2898801 RepID=UPI0025F81C44|nr:DUF2892 domain-containing protein [Seleniivibrio sp.]MCD8553964.1 DUF2892 domain-containing protein [Seleniivibrio sp.]
MSIKDILRLVPGIFILVSVGLTVATDNKWWLLLAAFVGLNLLQSAFTKWCLLEDILRKMGIREV